MAVFVNTSDSAGPEWVLSGVGIIGKIAEIASEAGLEVYGINSSRTNLPSYFEVSTSDGVIAFRLHAGDADEVESEIRKYLGLTEAPATASVVETTDVPDVEFIPSTKLEEMVDEAVASEKAAPTKKK